MIKLQYSNRSKINNMKKEETEFLKEQLIKLSLEVFECKKEIKDLKTNFNRLVEVTETIVKNTMQ